MKEHKESTVSHNVIMANGKFYNDGAGLDIFAVLGLRCIERCPALPIHQKLSVAEHSWLCGILVTSYCDFMAKSFEGGKFKETYDNITFRYMLTQAVLTHDVEEIIFADIPAPVKIPGLDEIKNDVRSKIRGFLKVSIPTANAIEMGVKHIDKISALIEGLHYEFVSSPNDISREFRKYYMKYANEHPALIEWIKYLGVPVDGTSTGEKNAIPKGKLKKGKKQGREG